MTWIFYAREEVARARAACARSPAPTPSCWTATSPSWSSQPIGAVEAGCQGTLRHGADPVGGVAAHTARPYMGINALRRLSPVLGAVAAARPRLDRDRGRLLRRAVRAGGGQRRERGATCSPTQARLVINHRFAPDRSAPGGGSLAALAHRAAARRAGRPPRGPRRGPRRCPRARTTRLLAALVALSGSPVAAKVGWTDVATFAERGVPAANFGAGDPELAHHPDEQVAFEELDQVASVLRRLLGAPGAA